MATFSEKGGNAVGSLAFITRPLRLDGQKFSSTGTLFSDYLTVTATTDHDSVATVVVPADRAGVKLVDDCDGFGQRRTGTGTTTFSSVAVAADEVWSDSPYDAEPVPTVQYASLQLFIHAVVAGILANVVDDDVAPQAATRLLELGGASTASRQRNLDRHWRNIRTITLHSPVAYMAGVVGENLLHGTPLPANAYF